MTRTLRAILAALNAHHHTDRKANAMTTPPIDRVTAELDRLASLDTVTRHDSRADSFGTGARWVIRMVREAMGGEVLSRVPSAPADRAARWEAAAHAAGREVDRNALAEYMAVADAEQVVLIREAIDRLETRARQAPAPGARLHSFRDVARVLIAELHGMAGEAQQPTAEGVQANLDTLAAEVVAAMHVPCSFPPCDTGPGEPCDTHERLWAHAEGDHELCGPECPAAPCTCGSEDHTHDGGCPLYAPAVAAPEAAEGAQR